MASIIKHLCESVSSVKKSFLILDAEDKALVVGLCVSGISGGLIAYNDNILFRKMARQFVVTVGFVSVGALTGWLIHVYRPISYCIAGLTMTSILVNEIISN